MPFTRSDVISLTRFADIEIDDVFGLYMLYIKGLN